MEYFEVLKQEVISEIKQNPHRYPSICRRMVRRIEALTAEIKRLKREPQSI